jgi:hypothetical protein
MAYDFRQIRWGMSMADVEAVERRPDDSDATGLYFSPREIGGYKASIIYKFQGERLVFVIISLLENPKHTEKYQEALKDWGTILNAKYGKGRAQVDSSVPRKITAWVDWTTSRSEIGLYSKLQFLDRKAPRNELRIFASEPEYFMSRTKPSDDF